MVEILVYNFWGNIIKSLVYGSCTALARIFFRILWQGFLLNRPTGQFQSLSRDVRLLYVCAIGCIFFPQVFFCQLVSLGMVALVRIGQEIQCLLNFYLNITTTKNAQNLAYNPKLHTRNTKVNQIVQTGANKVEWRIFIGLLYSPDL